MPFCRLVPGRRFDTCPHLVAKCSSFWFPLALRLGEFPRLPSLPESKKSPGEAGLDPDAPGLSLVLLGASRQPAAAGPGWTAVALGWGLRENPGDGVKVP